MPTHIRIPKSSHAVLSASGADRWMACPASIRLSEGLDTSNEAAAAGTARHWLAERAFNSGAAPENYRGMTLAVEKWKFTVDERMISEVNFALDQVISIKDWELECTEELSEVDLTPDLRALHPDLGGIADVVLWDRGAKTVYVVDFKFGRHLVEAKANTQLMVYALGAQLRFPEAERFVLCIIMPQWKDSPWAYQTHEVWWDELLLDFALRLVTAARQPRNAKPVTGPHCRWCPARHGCPQVEALRKLSRSTTKLSENEMERVNTCGAVRPVAGYHVPVFPPKPAVSDFEPLD